MSTLVLSFFADGPRWDNLALVPAYPSGYSYPRPFRYRSTWVQQALQENLKTSNGLTALRKEHTVLAFRFRDPAHQWKLLPVRKAVITHVDENAGTPLVFFTLGEFLSFHTTDPADSLIEVAEAERAGIGDALFFRLSAAVDESKWAKPEDAVTAWSALVDSIGSAKFPVNPEGQRSLFAYLDKLRSTGIGKPARIRISPSEGPIWGLRLKEGKSCELVIHHRLPALLNQNTGPKAFQLMYLGHTSNIETSAASALVTSNYDRHAFTVSGIWPTRETEQLTIHSDDAAAQDGTPVSGLDCPINLRIARSFWYRLKATYVWFFLLVGALALSSLASIWASQITGSSSSTPAAPTTPQVIQAIGASALAAFFIFMIQQRLASPRH